MHSVFMSKYLTTGHQLLMEELSVALYHDRYHGGFLSDVIPGHLGKDAVLVCVNKGMEAASIMEAAIALQWIKPTRAKRSVRITNQQAPISVDKNKREVNEVSMKKSWEITSQDDLQLLPRPQAPRPAASDDIPFTAIAAISSVPNTPVAAKLPPVVEFSAVSFVAEVEIDKEGDEGR
jgi:hypothetical protein